MSKEIEIRNELFNKEQVICFLNNIGIEEFKHSHQIDTYYDNPTDSFFKDPKNVNDWVRIREENGSLTFTYKHWLPDGADIRTYCEETEYAMQSKADLCKILKKLNFSDGFVPLIVIEKIRKNFMYRDCEISIDEVRNLGTFIEIEYKGTDDNVENVMKLLNNILIEIGAKVGPSDHKGYVYHLLKKQGYIGDF